MRLLFDMDPQNYSPDGTVFIRNSARCITVSSGRVAMVYSKKYNYYKFPGGGIEKHEDPVQAMIRETLEEAGLSVISESVKEYGYVHRIQKDDMADNGIFVQDNYYYICSVDGSVKPQQLDPYEADAEFSLVWIDPDTAISANRDGSHGSAKRMMLEREAKVLELLKKEGFFN